MSKKSEIAKARAFFPRGLEQPEGSFRFSLDALLLARFAAVAPPFQETLEPFESNGEACTLPAGDPSFLHDSDDLVLLPPADAAPASLPEEILESPQSDAAELDINEGGLGGLRSPSRRRQKKSRQSFHHKPFKLADLGTGCGVIALNMLLDHPTAEATGFEIGPELAQAAQNNAAMLGVEDRFSALTVNLADVTAKKKTIKKSSDDPYIADSAVIGGVEAGQLEAESFDLVVSNPPYRRSNQGRHAATESRTRALFETAGALEVFAGAAVYLVKNKGRFCCIYPAERLAELVSALEAVRLTPKRLRPVYSKLDREATLVLLEARKNGNSGLTLEPPLVLYSGEATVLSDAALEFCPALACNARGRNS